MIDLQRLWLPVGVLLAVLGPLTGSVPTAFAQTHDSARPFLGGETSQDVIAAELRDRVPRAFRQVGTSSVTLRIDFNGGGGSAAFKPRTRAHPRGFQAEVVAYRIARQLEMDNVPPVVLRRLPRPLLENRFEGENPNDWEPLRREILWDNPGVARGAAIYWIPNMERTELATMTGLDAAVSALQVGGEIPDGQAPAMRDLSTMIAYDYLIANWDRFSGGNVSTDTSGRLFVRDHNVAFQAPLSEPRYARIRELLERVQRFSRTFIERVRELDQDALETAVVGTEGGRPLLLPSQIEGILERRRALLSYVGGLAALHGTEQVLYWD